MKIAAHITFFYIEDRLSYLNQVVSNLLEIDAEVDIFIYTNRIFNLSPYNKNVKYFVFDYSNNLFNFSHKSLFYKMEMRKFIHPYYLTWESRKKIPDLINQYDVQLYLEDDIAFTQDNLNYWLQYKDFVMKYGYNLGFLRIESNDDQVYITDLTEELTEIIEIENQKFLINTINPYCGFWIYSREELKEFIKSEEWFFRFNDYDIRAKSAIGWHGMNMSRYKGTLIPLYKNDNRYFSVKESAIHHLPNNYIGQSIFCATKFPIVVRHN